MRFFNRGVKHRADGKRKLAKKALYNVTSHVADGKIRTAEMQYEGKLMELVGEEFALQ